MDITSSVVFLPETSVGRLQEALATVLNGGAKSLIMLGCDADHWAPATTDPLLTTLTAPVFGGIFPSIIHNSERVDHGTLLVGLTVPVAVSVVGGLSIHEDNLHAEVRHACTSLTAAPSLITFVDGLAKNIERFVDGLYNVLGPGPDVVGCGAGSLDFTQKPCLFTNSGLIQDAGIVVGLPFQVSRGVRHGWEVLDGPYLVTGSRGNVLETLNYRPAFDVYRDRVEKASTLRFAEHDFFSIAKTYPLGIKWLDGDLLVRDPIRLEGHALVCVGNVPENAVVYILKGQAEHLVESARTAAVEARAGYGERHSQAPSALILDCISRVLFLDGEFDQELGAIQQGLGAVRHTFGALTLGEITNTRNGPITLLNKSTVIGVF
jgi:hypothetical protein